MSKEKINPWFTIWFSPRRTMDNVLKGNPEKYITLIAALAGINSILSSGLLEAFLNIVDLHIYLGICLVIGPLYGIVAFYFYTALVFWSGEWLKGKAELEHIMAALGWAQLPYLVGLLLWIPKLFIFGRYAFVKNKSPMFFSDIEINISKAFEISEWTLMVCSIVLTIITLAKVQKFSLLKGLINPVLAVLMPYIPWLFITSWAYMVWYLGSLI